MPKLVKTVPKEVDPKKTNGIASNVTKIKRVFPERIDLTESSIM